MLITSSTTRSSCPLNLYFPVSHVSMQYSAVNHPYFIPCGQDTQSCLRYCSDAKVSVLRLSALDTSVNAALSGEPTLRSAIGSQTQVPTLTVTWKNSHFPFCSDSQDIFFFYWTMKKIIPSNRILRLRQRLYSFFYSPAGVALLGGGRWQKENGWLSIFWDTSPSRSTATVCRYLTVTYAGACACRAGRRLITRSAVWSFGIFCHVEVSLTYIF